MKKILIGLILVLLLYLALWPVPIEPEAWQAPIEEGYVGDFEANTKLATFESISLDGNTGPEAIASDSAGWLYASTHEGWVLRWQPGDRAAKKWVEVGGRPLGLVFDAADNLWVADAYSGLIKVTPDKQVTTQLSEFEGKSLSYPDDLIVSPTGKVYFSDASDRFAAREWGGTLAASILDTLEHSRSGRIIEFDPQTKESRVLMDDISFANGVVIDPTGQFLLVVETGEYRVLRHWLTGQNAGTTEVVIDNLPGFPDNIHLGSNGRYWVGLTAPRDSAVDGTADKPWLRKVIQRLPTFMQPSVKHYGFVFAMDANGKVLANLQAPAGEVYATTGAYETDEFLFVTSLTAPFAARYRKADLGLE